MQCMCTIVEEKKNRAVNNVSLYVHDASIISVYIKRVQSAIDCGCEVFVSVVNSGWYLCGEVRLEQ